MKIRIKIYEIFIPKNDPKKGNGNEREGGKWAKGEGGEGRVWAFFCVVLAGPVNY